MRETQTFICMGCGFCFTYEVESRQPHVCVSCAPFEKQSWGIMGYPPHRTREGYQRDIDDQLLAAALAAEVRRRERAEREMLKRVRANRLPLRSGVSTAARIYTSTCSVPGCTRKGHPDYGLCAEHLKQTPPALTISGHRFLTAKIKRAKKTKKPRKKAKDHQEAGNKEKLSTFVEKRRRRQA